MQKTFRGYRRENGRVGVRNHVIILPVDDLSNAACEAVAHNIKGAMAIPHPYGRLQFGADLDLHFRTLIGTGANPECRRGRRDRHRGPVDAEGRRRHQGHRQAGRGLRHRAARRPRHDHARVEGGARVRAVGERAAARRVRRSTELWVSTKCGESDTTSGCGANPTVGDAFDKLYAAGLHAGVRRDDRADRRRADRRRALPRRHGARAVHGDVRPLPAGDRPAQDVRPLRLAADQGQHRRRPDDDRGEGARQHPEDRQEVRRRRRARQGRGADRPRPVVHGFVVGGGRDGDAVRGVGLRRPLLPDRAGQRDRQPDPAGDQDLRESAHRAHDERARRRRHLGPAAARDHDGRGRRQGCST